MSACTVVLNRPDDLENRARVEVMQSNAARRWSRPMSACTVVLNRPDDLENGARVAAMHSDAGVIR
ncbi:MAG: hypothetical protein Q8S33_38455 [Myxococcales bacterium]|nr:hypothetical protein [Myxococcales bacterium]